MWKYSSSTCCIWHFFLLMPFSLSLLCRSSSFLSPSSRVFWFPHSQSWFFLIFTVFLIISFLHFGQNGKIDTHSNTTHSYTTPPQIPSLIAVAFSALHIIWIIQCVVPHCLISQRDLYAHSSDSVSRTDRKSWTHTLNASIRWAQHRWRLGNEDPFPTQGETRIRSYRWTVKWRWADYTQWERLQRCWQWWVRVRTPYFSSSICGH